VADPAAQILSSQMNLTPREKDKLLVSVAAMVAERRLKRGVKLNYLQIRHTHPSPKFGSGTK